MERIRAVRCVHDPEHRHLLVPSKLVHETKVSVHDSVTALDDIPPTLLARVQTRGLAEP